MAFAVMAGDIQKSLLCMDKLEHQLLAVQPQAFYSVTVIHYYLFLETHTHTHERQREREHSFIVTEDCNYVFRKPSNATIYLHRRQPTEKGEYPVNSPL